MEVKGELWRSKACGEEGVEDEELEDEVKGEDEVWMKFGGERRGVEDKVGLIDEVEEVG